MRRKVNLVDDEQVGAGDAGAALARNLVAARHVNDVDGDVHELGAEGRREVVAAALDEDEFQARQGVLEVRDGLQVHRGVLAYGRVRAAAGLDAAHALGGERPLTDEKLGVLFGVDVVGHHRQVDPRPQLPAQVINQRRLAAAHGAGDADAEGARVMFVLHGHSVFGNDLSS